MNVFWATLIVVVVAALAIAAMLLVRRRAPEGSYFEDGDRAAGRRQYLRRRSLAPCRRYEQLGRRSGQAQRTRQQHGGVFVGGASDAPLQVTDRPRGQSCRLRQLFLGQFRLAAQLPQHPGERKRRLLRHGPTPLATLHHRYQLGQNGSCSKCTGRGRAAAIPAYLG